MELKYYIDVIETHGHLGFNRTFKELKCSYIHKINACDRVF